MTTTEAARGRPSRFHGASRDGIRGNKDGSAAAPMPSPGADVTPEGR